MPTTIIPGFADPILSAQSSFRAIMDAIARPGMIVALTESVTAPRPLSRAAAIVALTLCDQDTPVWLDAGLAAPEVAYWLRFHTGAPITSEPQRAAFGFLADPQNAPAFAAFAQGTAEYPDRSSTLILQVKSLEDGPSLALCGPGVKGQSTLRARPLPQDFVRRLAANRALFPRGVDLLLVTDTAIAALPRSVRLVGEP